MGAGYLTRWSRTAAHQRPRSGEGHGMFRISSRFYVVTFRLIVLLLWPLVVWTLLAPFAQGLGLPGEFVLALLPLLYLLNFGLYRLVASRNAAQRMSFGDGLMWITDSSMSGCANITILYIYFLLASIYVLAVLNVGNAALNGSAAASDRWIRIVMWFGKDRQKASREV